MTPKVLRPEVFPYASVEIVPAPPLRLICAWCTTQLRDGVLPASHTICPACVKKFDGGARATLTALLLLVGLFLAAPCSAQDKVGPAPYLVLTIGNSLDLATTLHGIHGGRAKEGNPLWTSAGTAGFVAIKTGSALAMGLAMRQLASHGHPRAAKVLGYTAGFALIGVGVHNARVGRR